MEWYRPVDPSTVPRTARRAAEEMLAHAKRDLGLSHAINLHWFAASDTPLGEGWNDPVINALNTNFTSGDHRNGLTTDERTIWCRADLTGEETAKTVAHEVRHAWQVAQESWNRPVAGGKDALAFIAAHHPVVRRQRARCTGVRGETERRCTRDRSPSEPGERSGSEGGSVIARVITITFLLAALVAGCSGEEGNTYNAFFYDPDGREEFVGQVKGLSACQRAAGARAAALGINSGWSYICCWQSGGSSCREKHR